MKSVAIIPARGSSVRIPRKNIKMFHGQPIIAYSIKAALDAGIFDKVFVSTDDPEIAAVATEYGATPLMRSAELSRDEIGTQQVMRAVLEQLAEDRIVHACCVYPCAPMLSADTLRRAYKLLTPGTPYVVPVGTWLRDPGQFYFGNANAFLCGADLHTSGTKMLWIDPATEIDINTQDDWRQAEQMFLTLKGQ